MAGIDYLLLNHGDGHTAFDGADIVSPGEFVDNQVIVRYINDTLGGIVGNEYADPLGQGRITIK